MLTVFFIFLLVVLILDVVCSSSAAQFFFLSFMLIFASIAFHAAIQLQRENRGLKAEVKVYETLMTETAMARLLAPLKESE